MNRQSSDKFRPNASVQLRRRGLSMAIAMSVAMLYVPAAAWAQQTDTTTDTSAGTGQPVPQQPKKAAVKDGVAELTTVTVTGVRASLQSAISTKQNADQIVDSIVATDIGKLPDSNVAEALQRISGIQIDRSYGEGSSIAIRGLTQVRTEINGRDAFTANGGRALSFEDVPAELLAGVDVYKNPSAEIIEGGLGGTVNLRTHKPFDFEGQKLSLSAEYSHWDLADKSEPSASILWSNRWNTDYGEFGALIDVAYQKHAFRRDDITNQPFYEIQASPDSPETNYPGYYGKTLYVPHGGGVNETDGGRRRLGIDVALQWRPNNDTELYFQGLRSAYKFRWNDYSTFTYTGTNPIIPDPTAPFEFGPDGSFISGTFNGSGDGMGGYTDGVGTDSNSSLTTRYSVTTDLSLGGSWNATNNLTLSTNVQYIKATTQELRYILGTHTTASSLYQNIGGSLPVLTVPEADVTNPDTTIYNFALDNKDRSYGRELAWRADGEYSFAGDFLQSVKFGVRTTDRKAVTYDTAYSDYVYIGQPLSNFPDSSWVYKSYSDLLRSDADTYGNVILPNPDMLNQYPNSKELFGVTGPLTYGPNNRNAQGEKTYAAYGVLRFGWQMGDIPVDGNVGVRAVQTKVSSVGVMNDPTGTGAYLPVDVNQSYNSYLPSLNLTAHLTDTLQWRIAASKGISRPNFSDLNPTLGLSTPDGAGGNTYTGSAGNPNLGPMKAKQFDTSLEWYYNPSSLVYAALFYKGVDGFISHSVFNETYNDHVYQVARPVNGDSGVIKGAEAGWQTFFDFLPSPFDGLGMQLNYTYVYSKAPSPAAADTSGNALQVPLEGLSKNSYNAILMYEKGPFEARVAYNWRSRWVVTTQGNGTGNLPVYNDAYGQMDASVTYHVNQHFDLTLAGTNLTDAKLKTLFGPRPGDVQINDRVYSLRAQLTF